MKSYLLSLQVQLAGVQLAVDALTKMLNDARKEPHTPVQTPRPEFLEPPGAPPRLREQEQEQETVIVPSITATLVAASPAYNALMVKSAQELRDIWHGMNGKPPGLPTAKPSKLSNKDLLVTAILEKRQAVAPVAPVAPVAAPITKTKTNKQGVPWSAERKAAAAAKRQAKDTIV